MKIEDLKRGYFVRHGNDIKQVYYFDDDTVYFYDLTKAKAEECQPVVLNGEILTRNGFEVEFGSEGNTIYSLDCVKLIKNNGDAFSRMLISNRAYTYTGYINYLHEVQDAFCACAVTLDWKV